MKLGFFIQANNKQILGAKLAEYAFLKHSKINVLPTIINVDNLEIFKKLDKKSYFRKGRRVIYNSEDLQSFTLSRFMPPELMGFEGRSIVIDPDIFALKNIDELFALDLKDNFLAACKKGDFFDSSVMVLENALLKNWKINEILKLLTEGRLDYDEIMSLKIVKRILPLDRKWNELDQVNNDTNFLHTTNRITQPWKEGLKIDFTRNETDKILKIIPRKPILRLLGKLPNKYQKHPDQNVRNAFAGLLKNALHDNFISEEFVKKEIALGHVRSDLLDIITT